MADAREPLENDAYECFANALAALELESPGASGNARTAYAKAFPKANPKSCQTKAPVLYRNPDVFLRVQHLIDVSRPPADANQAAVIHTAPFIDMVAYDAYRIALANGDAGNLRQIAELLDRARPGGPKWVKLSRNEKVPADNPLAGKSAAEVRAIREEAARVLAAHEDQEKRKRERRKPDDGGAGASDRSGEPVH